MSQYYKIINNKGGLIGALDKKDFTNQASIYLLNDTTLNVGFEKLICAVKYKNSNFVQNKYYYTNIWSIACEPCVDEIPLLDKIVMPFNKSLNCLMVSPYSDKAVNNFLLKRQIQMQNFTFINGMIDFISGVYNEINMKKQSFPLHVVLDQNGMCLAYLHGAFHDIESATPLTNYLNQLK